MGINTNFTKKGEKMGIDGSTIGKERKKIRLINCEVCKTEISPKSPSCPNCGHPNKKAKYLSAGQMIVYTAIAIGIFWFLNTGNFMIFFPQNTKNIERQVAEDIHKIEKQVASDTVAQYEIAKREGSKIQICVQAGFVSAAFLQAKDEQNYQKWKRIEKEDCQKAGL